MWALVIDLGDFFRGDKKLDINYTVPVGEINQNLSASPVDISGRLISSSGLVRLDFTAATSLSGQCDRCLFETVKDFNSEFSHVLVQNTETEDYPDDFVVCPDSKLDLDELVKSDILLSLPYNFLCSEDCAGLCAGCGARLDTETCKCEKQL